MIVLSRNVYARFCSLFCFVLPFSIHAVEQNPKTEIGMHTSLKNGESVFGATRFCFGGARL